MWLLPEKKKTELEKNNYGNNTVIIKDFIPGQ